MAQQNSDSVTPVRRFNFTLPDDLAGELERAAQRQGVSVSELVREAITLRLAYEMAVRAGEHADVGVLLSEVLATLRRLERPD